MKGWIDLGGDVSWADYGGKWGKKGRDGAWYVVRFENLQEAMGRDAPCKYSCDVLRVDPRHVPEKEITQAKQCVGLSLDTLEPEYHEQAIVEALVSYGVYSPLATFDGDKYPVRIRAQARREAEDLMHDSVALAEALGRPVNALGSTALDFGRGDVLAGLRSYAEEVAAGKQTPDSPAKNLMLKLTYGVDAASLAKTDAWMKLRNADPLAFAMGFLHGESTGEVETGEDYAEAYMAGQEWGVLSKQGKLPWPPGIKRQGQEVH